MIEVTDRRYDRRTNNTYLPLVVAADGAWCGSIFLSVTLKPNRLYRSTIHQPTRRGARATSLRISASLTCNHGFDILALSASPAAVQLPSGCTLLLAFCMEFPHRGSADWNLTSLLGICSFTPICAEQTAAKCWPVAVASNTQIPSLPFSCLGCRPSNTRRAYGRCTSASSPSYNATPNSPALRSAWLTRSWTSTPPRCDGGV